MHKNVNNNVLSINCILEENKICDNCCECFICDLDPGKICDNCANCLKVADYKAVIIDDILILEESRGKKKKRMSDKTPVNR